MSELNQTRKLVYCHHCENEWYEDEHGLTCPACQSEFIEIIEPSLDPRRPNPQPSPFHSHNPWAAAPDPDEGDIDQLGWRSNGPGNLSLSGTFYRSPSGQLSSNTQSQQPTFQAPYFDDLQQIVQSIAGSAMMQGPFSHGSGTFTPQQERFRPRSAQDTRSTFPDQRRAFEGPRVEFRTASGPNFSFTTRTTTLRPEAGDETRQPLGGDDIHMLLNNLFASSGGSSGAAGQPMNPLSAIFQSIFQPAMAAHGDAVYSQEALDRVISHLMEQNASGNAPGPASGAAIAALPKKRVEADLLDDEGRAECSICMETVQIGDEVSLLPCSHWFHPACIAAWLREHDTCPHCRAGITPKEGSRNTVRSPTEAPLNNQDPFELARRQSGTREHPYVVSESPSQQRRQPGYRRQSSSAMESSGPNDSRAQGQGEAGGGGSGGGITGSLRNWFSGGAGGPAAGGSRR